MLTVSACCNGGLRLAWDLPPMGNQPAVTMTVDSPMDGTEVPTVVAGKPSGQTMAVIRVDSNHYRAIAKMGGKPFGISNGAVAADGKTMMVESAFEGGGTTQKIIETWVRK